MFPSYMLVKKDLALFAGLFAHGYATEKLIVIEAIPFYNNDFTEAHIRFILFYSMEAVRRGNSIQVDSFISLRRRASERARKRERERDRGCGGFNEASQMSSGL